MLLQVARPNVRELPNCNKLLEIGFPRYSLSCSYHQTPPPVPDLSSHNDVFASSGSSSPSTKGRAGPPRLRSDDHRSSHAFILFLDCSLPMFTVGMTFSILKLMINMVSSRKLLCSEYGTPKHMASLVLPRCATKSLYANLVLQTFPCNNCWVDMVDGDVFADICLPFAGRKVHPVGRKPTIRLKCGLYPFRYSCSVSARISMSDCI